MGENPKKHFKFFMLLFSAENVKKNQKKIAHEKLKKLPKKVAHNLPKPFFPHSSPGHSPQPKIDFLSYEISGPNQKYTYRVLQTIHMKLILLWVWAELAVLGRSKTGLKFKYEI